MWTCQLRHPQARSILQTFDMLGTICPHLRNSCIGEGAITSSRSTASREIEEELENGQKVQSHGHPCTRTYYRPMLL